MQKQKRAEPMSAGHMPAIVHWCDWNGEGLERCHFSETAEGFVLEGVLIGTREGHYGAHYLVRTDAHFHTRQVRVAYVGGPCLEVDADGQGRWWDRLNGEPLAFLDGCLDVDLGVTPATNTLPIRRLKLAAQASAEIEVAYIPLPSEVAGQFLPQRAPQRYTCLVAGSRYRYDGIFREFFAELDVDQHGLVLDYPPMFRRVHGDLR